MMKNKQQYLSIDLYNGKSKWISQKDFLAFTIGDEYDGKDSKGYYYEYKTDVVKSGIYFV